MKRLALVTGLLLAGCHSDWDAIYADCVNSGRCVDGGAPEDAGPSITVDRSPLNFADVVVFERGAAEQVIITNAGPGAVASLSLQLQGGNFADFVLTPQCQGELLEGATCTANLVFAPLGVSLRSTALRITPAGQPALDVALSGNALPAIEFTPSPLVFPDTSAGSQSRQSITVKNNTSAPQSPVFIFSNAAFQKDTSCALIAAHASCNFVVTFAPPEAERFIGTLSASVGPPSQTFNATLALSGNGLALGSLRLSPASLFDGQVVDAGSERFASFTLSNVAPTAIGPITVTLQPPGSVFSIVDAGCVTLDAGTSCTGALRFAPTSIGAFDATLVANAGLGGIATAPLSGIGAGTFVAQLTVTPNGRVTALDGGFQCTGSCSLPLYVVPPAYPTVVLEAQPSSPQSVLDSWSGDCGGRASTCDVVMNRDQVASAHFGPVNLAFVTSFATQGDFGGTDGGDALCQAAALDAGWHGSFVAWLASNKANPGNLLPDAGGWVRVDGRPFANSPKALVRGEVLYPLTLDEHGVAVDGGLVWTNALPDGSSTVSGHCTGWTSAVVGSRASVGVSSGGSTLWTHASLERTCNTSQRLYCLQVDPAITPPPLAVPPGGQVMFLSSLAELNRGAAALDTLCSQEGQAAGLGGDFNALVGGSTSTPASRISQTATGPLYRPDGVVLRGDVSELRTTEVDFFAAPNVTADGGFVVDDVAPAAVGALGVLTLGSDHCLDWSTEVFVDTLRVAEPRMASVRSTLPSLGGYFSRDAVGACSAPARVYCVPR